MNHAEGPAKTLLLALCGLSLCTAAGAAFDLEHTGARSLGMAGAFCGLADDADAVYYNPAGLAQNRSVLIALDHSRLLGGLEDGTLAENRLAYVQPLRDLGSLGLAWHQLDFSGVYQENLFSLDYGVALEPSQRSFLGGGLRILNVGYNTAVANGNDFFAGTASRTGVSLDLGGLFFLDQNFCLGASLFNILPARVALQQDADPLPLQVRLGAGYHGSDLSAAADILAYAGRYRAAVGGEWWWFERTVAARLGLGCGDSGLLETGAGLSLNLNFGVWGGQLDYAYQLPWGEAAGLGGSHHLNVTFRLEMETPETVAGRKYLQAGRQAYAGGKQAEALENWEQAARLLPADPEPARLIRALQDEISRAQPAERTESETVREKEKAAPKNTAAPKWQRPEAEAVPAPARTAESAAGQSAAEKNPKSLRRGQEPQVRPEAAGAALREKRPAPAAKPAEVAPNPPAEAATPASGKPAMLPKAAPRAVESKTGLSTPTAVPAADRSGSDAAQLRRRARGAYGRAVKMMLEIDNVSGSTFFPGEYRALQKELQVMKLLLKSEDYQKIIENAERLFPALEKLKRRSIEKKTNREIMPTHW